MTDSRSCANHRPQSPRTSSQCRCASKPAALESLRLISNSSSCDRVAMNQRTATALGLICLPQPLSMERIAHKRRAATFVQKARSRSNQSGHYPRLSVGNSGGTCKQARRTPAAKPLLVKPLHQPDRPDRCQRAILGILDSMSLLQFAA